MLRGLNLAVPTGQIMAVLGANGAGKSVLLKTIFGALACWEGEIRFEGEDITRLGTDERFRRGMGLIPQHGIVFPALSVEENLLMGAGPSSGSAARREMLDAAWDRHPGLLAMRRSPAGNLSGGQQKLVAIARALMRRPRLLLLDEPSIGLDPINLAAIGHEIEAINATGITVLLVEQNVRFALRFAHTACLLELGLVTQVSEAASFLQGGSLFGVNFTSGVGAPGSR